MTNIQTLPNKSQPAESGRAAMGNFFQAPAAPVAGNLSNPDFDSFLSNPDSKNQAEELREEQEAAKKRKKPVDAALTQTSAPLSDSPIEVGGNSSTKTNESKNLEQIVLKDLNTEPNTSKLFSTKDSSENTTSPTEAIVSKDSTDTIDAEPISQISTEGQVFESELKQTELNNLSEEKPDSRGTESAPADDEMIAMATMDGLETPTQPLREPAITSINRLAAYATLDRNAVTPLTNSGASSDSGLGNNASGLPTAIQSIKSSSATPSTQAAGLFKSLAPELDKFKQTGSSQIQLDLPVGDDESVRIKLSMRGGEIRSTFITESPELREALQKAWPEFSQNSRDRGYRLGDPSFQQSFQENNANLGQNNRRQPEGRPLEASEVFGSTNVRKPSATRTSATNSPSTALWA